jgi:prolyl oligopeptidase
MKRTRTFGGMAALLLASMFVYADDPMSKRTDLVETLHGVEVPDPYRWLEEDVRESDTVAAWVGAQNKHTEAFFKQIPQRERINRRLTELWDFEKYGTPFKAGGRIYFYKNDGLQDQYVLYVQDSFDDEPRVLIDPNEWSEDGTVALAGTSFSDDGRYVTYSVQDAGSDWRVWKILEIATGKVLEEELRWIKFNTPAWTPDGTGFFYARFPEPEEGAAFQTLNLNQAVYYHRVGTDQSEDVLVFHRPDQPKWGYYNSVSEDGNYLIITVSVGTDDRYRVFYKDLREPFGLPVPLVDNFENEYSFIGNDGPVFYFKTDLEAPRGRVIAVDIRNVPVRLDLPPEGEGDAAEVQGPSAEGEPPSASPSSAPPHREIIPQQAEAMRDVSLVGNLFIVESLRDAKTHVSLFRPDGEFLRAIEFPGIGSASGFSGKRTDTETFYSFSSFDTPPSIYRYDLFTGESTLLRQAEVDFDPEEYEVKQVFYESKDGTRIPMFLVHKSGLKLDGDNPVLLYGYGGFNIPMTPGFSISRLAWMELGGVFAMPNLRGGGEYGEEWHKAGTKLNKQNVFDDFIAAAEWLIENRYTRPEKLAIQGGSNGGLLVGACMTQRPDLYGACLAAVGVFDMLRFHKFTAGRYWVDDFGSPDDPEEFKALLAYSPYHNVKEGTCYPPTLITTADTDDRVIPGHSFKFTAALQHAQGCENPILIRIETRAGHGAGKPTSKIIEELTDQWAFLTKVLEMESTPASGEVSAPRSKR